MTDSLHETHRWSQWKGIPICVICRVEGYEDEPAAFTPCPGLPEKSPRCLATLRSRDDLGHTHRCIGGHRGGYHFCRFCRRWFGTR
jgi:hypothetical protein